MARTLVASDDFDRAGLGANWTQTNTYWGAVGIAGNELSALPRPDLRASTAEWVADSFAADQYASLEITGYSYDNLKRGAVGVRMSGSNSAGNDTRSGYWAYLYSDSPASGTAATYLQKIVNGTLTTLASIRGDGFLIGDRLEIEAVGTTIRVLKNGVELRSVSDGDVDGTGTHAGTLGGGDNWEAGNLTGGAVVEGGDGGAGGTAVAAGVVDAIAAGIGAAEGAGLAAGAPAATIEAAGLAAGRAAADAVGQAVAAGIGSGAGVAATTEAIMSAVAAGFGLTGGQAFALAAAGGIAAAAGEAAGQAQAGAVAPGGVVAEGVGHAAGQAVAGAGGSAAVEAIGAAAAAAGAGGLGTGLAGAIGLAAGQAAAAAVSGAPGARGGAARGQSMAAAIGAGIAAAVGAAAGQAAAAAPVVDLSAAHLRTQVRNAAVAAVTGLATTGAAVFVNRARALAEDELPALLVRTRQDDLEVDAMGRAGAGQTAYLAIEVAGLVASTAVAVDDDLDRICEEVEAVLGGSRLGGLLKSIELVGTRFEVDGEAAAVFGAVTMTWRAMIRSPQGAAAQVA